MPRIEATVVSRLTVWALRRAGFPNIDAYNTKELDAVVGRIPTPAVVELDRGGQRAQVTYLGAGERPQTSRMAVEMKDARALSDVGRVLRSFHPSCKPERREDRARDRAAAAINRELAKAGATQERIEERGFSITPAIAEALMRVAPTIWDPLLRGGLMECLALAKKPPELKLRIARWLIDLWPRTPESDVRQQMAAALAALRVREVAEDLLRLLRDRRWGYARGDLCDALAASGHPKALDAIVGALGDPAIAAWAVATLGKMKAKLPVARIRPFLKHKEGLVRRGAKKLLIQLGERFPSPPAPVHRFRGRVPKGLEEWSTNADLDQLGRMLKPLAGLVQSGFGRREIEEVIGAAEDIPVEQTRTFRFAVRHAGQKSDVFLSLFMDDVDAPDLAIYSCKSLVEAFATAVIKSMG